MNTQIEPEAKTIRMRQAVQIPRARNIARTLGTVCAARYLAKRGWSVEAAVYILFHH